MAGVPAESVPIPSKFGSPKSFIIGSTKSSIAAEPEKETVVNFPEPVKTTIRTSPKAHRPVNEAMANFADPIPSANFAHTLQASSYPMYPPPPNPEPATSDAASQPQSSKDDDASKPSQRFRSQFVKTRLCCFFSEPDGCRRGSRCDFAHGQQELNAAPNLSKTSVCTAWQSGKCEKKAEECPYAHGQDDLRVTRAFLKSGACKMFFKGKKCLAGKNCRHAHSLAEIEHTGKKLSMARASNKAFSYAIPSQEVAKVVDTERGGKKFGTRKRLQKPEKPKLESNVQPLDDSYNASNDITELVNVQPWDDSYKVSRDIKEHDAGKLAISKAQLSKELGYLYFQQGFAVSYLSL